jgi:hypothetical protein
MQKKKNRCEGATIERKKSRRKPAGRKRQKGQYRNVKNLNITENLYTLLTIASRQQRVISHTSVDRETRLGSSI